VVGNRGDIPGGAKRWFFSLYLALVATSAARPIVDERILHFELQCKACDAPMLLPAGIIERLFDDLRYERWGPLLGDCRIIHLPCEGALEGGALPNRAFSGAAVSGDDATPRCIGLHHPV
jgi:hypothetical protein